MYFSMYFCLCCRPRAGLRHLLLFLASGVSRATIFRILRSLTLGQKRQISRRYAVLSSYLANVLFSVFLPMLLSARGTSTGSESESERQSESESGCESASEGKGKAMIQQSTVVVGVASVNSATQHRDLCLLGASSSPDCTMEVGTVSECA